MTAIAAPFGRYDTTAKRRSSERYGRLAEIVAAVMLLLRGYRLIGWRFKTRQGEIDLIGVRGRRLVFVEVKARATAEAADVALASRQANRVADAAEAFLARQPRLMHHDISLDAILISWDRWPRYVPHALEAS